MTNQSFDVVVVGGGVIGAFVARELTKFQLTVCVVEAREDVGMGASGANSGIVHGGFDPVPGSLKARFNVEGCQMMRKVTSDLDVPFEMIGSMVVAHNMEEKEILKKLLKQGKENGAKGLQLLDSWELGGLEPSLGSDLKAALLSSESGIVCPHELTQGAMENAIHNGAQLYLSSPVTSMERQEDGAFAVKAGDHCLQARTVVNAAGIYADKVYEMAVECAVGDEIIEAHQQSFKITPRSGEYMLLDKSEGMTVCHVIFRIPGEMSKGIIVAPTVDGPLLLGPTLSPREDREDTSTTAVGMQQVCEGARKLVPEVNLSAVIKSYTGLRATTDRADHDFIVGRTPVKGFYNAAGIESPGLTSSPAIGQYLAETIAADLEAKLNPNFDPKRKHLRFNELSFEDQQELVAKDPSYGRIVCRCETITEGEVRDAIRRPCGARSVDGVKRRTRTGMGRCQGGFCSSHVVRILAEELGIDPTQVVKSTPGSYILTEKTKNQEGEQDA